jgi:hypothetical protein
MFIDFNIFLSYVWRTQAAGMVAFDVRPMMAIRHAHHAGRLPRSPESF